MQDVTVKDVAQLCKRTIDELLDAKVNTSQLAGVGKA
jgi:hypothetical protein